MIDKKVDTIETDLDLTSKEVLVSLAFPEIEVNTQNTLKNTPQKNDTDQLANIFESATDEKIIPESALLKDASNENTMLGNFEEDLKSVNGEGKELGISKISNELVDISKLSESLEQNLNPQAEESLKTSELELELNGASELSESLDQDLNPQAEENLKTSDLELELNGASELSESLDQDLNPQAEENLKTSDLELELNGASELSESLEQDLNPQANEETLNPSKTTGNNSLEYSDSAQDFDQMLTAYDQKKESGKKTSSEFKDSAYEPDYLNQIHDAPKNVFTDSQNTNWSNIVKLLISKPQKLYLKLEIEPSANLIEKLNQDAKITLSINDILKTDILIGEVGIAKAKVKTDSEENLLVVIDELLI